VNWTIYIDKRNSVDCNVDRVICF